MKMQLHSDETEYMFSFFVNVKETVLERKPVFRSYCTKGFDHTVPASATANHCVFDRPLMADKY